MFSLPRLPLAAVAMAAALAFAAPNPAVAEEDDGELDLLVILGSDSLQTQAMAMILANHTLERGRTVNILLCDDAGDLALEGAEAEPVQPPDRSPVQLMQMAMEMGATVQVCAIYLPTSGLEEDALAEGVSVAAPPEIVELMVDPTRQLMSF